MELVYLMKIMGIKSTIIKDKSILSAHYGGTWEKIGEKIEFGITVHYYKLIEK